MKRRTFIAGLGSAAAWPLVARAQQPGRMRRIGVLTVVTESDPEARSSITAFATRLRELGWMAGENVRIDYRWGGYDVTRMTLLAKELIELKPDVLLAATYASAVALRQYTLAIPHRRSDFDFFSGLLVLLCHKRVAVTSRAAGATR